MSATALGIVFLLGLVASGALVYFQGPTLFGTIGKTTAVSFALLTVAAFLL